MLFICSTSGNFSCSFIRRVLRWKRIVLVLLGVEVIFSTVTSIGLCFGFMLFFSVLNRDCTEARLFLLFTWPHCKEAGQEHSQDRWPRSNKRIFQTLWHHVQCIKWGEEGGMGFVISSDGVCHLKSLFCVMEPCSAGDTWATASW